ncbi:hypothetical protein ACNJ7E_01870 [Rhodococcus sp. NM-2]|uniref:hypothetical protein n=1 Tax=Rhodococcus sp. NM-2 TaxID=3401174 RepID=UPI003AADACBD
MIEGGSEAESEKWYETTHGGLVIDHQSVSILLDPDTPGVLSWFSPYFVPFSALVSVRLYRLDAGTGRIAFTVAVPAGDDPCHLRRRVLEVRVSEDDSLDEARSYVPGLQRLSAGDAALPDVDLTEKVMALEARELGVRAAQVLSEEQSPRLFEELRHRQGGHR